MSMKVLVLGATGGFGGAVADALASRGWQVVAMHRQPEKTAPGRPAIEWVKGDAMNPGDILRAAEGAHTIVHGINVPGYRNWEGTVVPMLSHAIEAAKATSARLLVPGSIYNYGPDAGHFLSEHSPQNPLTRKGRIRVRMERALADAAQHGARALILRSGDYFGPQSPSSWLTSTMAQPGKPVRRIFYPGTFGVGHSWAFLPDLGEAAAALIEAESGLPDFDSFHFEGHYLPRGEAIAEIIAELAGGARITPLPWWAVGLAAPFNTTMREIVELRYLWQQPHRLVGDKLRRLMGDEPRTPLREALRQTLEATGALAGRPRDTRPIATSQGQFA